MNKRGVTGIESDLGQIRLSPVSPAVAVRPYLTSKEKEKTPNLEKKNFLGKRLSCVLSFVFSKLPCSRRRVLSTIWILHIPGYVKIGMTYPPQPSQGWWRTPIVPELLGPSFSSTN